MFMSSSTREFLSFVIFCLLTNFPVPFAVGVRRGRRRSHESASGSVTSLSTEPRLGRRPRAIRARRPLAVSHLSGAVTAVSGRDPVTWPQYCRAIQP